MFLEQTIIYVCNTKKCTSSTNFLAQCIQPKWEAALAVNRKKGHLRMFLLLGPSSCRPSKHSIVRMRCWVIGSAYLLLLLALSAPPLRLVTAASRVIPSAEAQSDSLSRSWAISFLLHLPVYKMSSKRRTVEVGKSGKMMWHLSVIQEWSLMKFFCSPYYQRYYNLCQIYVGNSDDTYNTGFFLDVFPEL